MSATSSGESNILLSQIAFARSGDKGNHANIGVVAYGPVAYEYLRVQLSAECVGDFFAGLQPSKVVRYELPNVWALNFMLYDCLGGGASQSMRIDTQGKLLGTAIMELSLPTPENLAQLETSP